MSKTQSPDIVLDSGGGAYDPKLYDPQGLATALPSPDAVDEQSLAFFEEHGYLAVEQVFTPDEVQSAIDALDDLIIGDSGGRWQVMYEAAVRDQLGSLTADERRDRVRKLFHFATHEPRLDSLAHHPKMLGIVERLTGRPVRLFQDMALLKPPRGGREKPWHQDHAYFNLPMEERVVGVWIALDAATVANGCMQVLDGGHELGPIIHWKRRDWQICDTEVLGKRSIAAPLQPGGALFFDSLLPHGTPANDSDQRRRALQFHYAPKDGGTIDTPQRLAIFGHEGKDVTC